MVHVAAQNDFCFCFFIGMVIDFCKLGQRDVSSNEETIKLAI